MSFTCGILPAMDVSGMLAFRGGGGGSLKFEGLYAVLVCILRLEDCWAGWR